MRDVSNPHHSTPYFRSPPWPKNYYIECSRALNNSLYTTLTQLFYHSTFIVTLRFTTFSILFVFFRPADHHDELFYICLLFGVVVLILLSSILVVIGRIVLNKRRVNMAAKMQTSETGTTAIPAECTETISDDMDIDLTAPATIPSISRNNVRITLVDSSYI